MLRRYDLVLMNVCMTSSGLTRDAKIRDQSKGGLTFAVVRGHTSPRPSRFCSQSANRLNSLFANGWPHFHAKIDSVGGEKRKERVGQLTGSCTQFRNTEWHRGLATISLVVLGADRYRKKAKTSKSNVWYFKNQLIGQNQTFGRYNVCLPNMLLFCQNSQFWLS